MSFDKYVKYAHSVEQPNDYYNEIDSAIVSASIQYLDEKAQKIQSSPFEYFYEDIIQEKLGTDFQIILSEEEYEGMCDDAIECLEICDEFYKLSSRKVNTWLQSSLKVVDYLVLHYIQVVKNDKPKKYYKLGIERSRYQHLQDYSEIDIKDIGTKLKALYDFRNSNEHRTIISENGQHILIRPDRRKTLELVMDYFPVILNVLKEYYKN